MGLLDDAIREHLDLKRRRGADPAEIERAEREALGPVRRTPEEVPPGEIPASYVTSDPAAAGPAEPAPPVVYEHEDEEYWEDEPLEDRPAYPGQAPLPDELERTGPQTDEASLEFDRPSGQAPPDPHPAPPDPHTGGQQTVEYRLDEHPEAQPDEEGDDMLEETPEFLQDAPEHDRLWFEQRPPRDFDFDD